jgi:hypothetical protein
MQIALNTKIYPCDYGNIDIACIITILKAHTKPRRSYMIEELLYINGCVLRFIKKLLIPLKFAGLVYHHRLCRLGNAIVRL